MVTHAMHENKFLIQRCADQFTEDAAESLRKAGKEPTPEAVEQRAKAFAFSFFQSIDSKIDRKFKEIED